MRGTAYANTREAGRQAGRALMPARLGGLMVQPHVGVFALCAALKLHTMALFAVLVLETAVGVV